MKIIPYHDVVEAVAKMCVSACYELPGDVRAALEKAAGAEESAIGRQVLGELIENCAIAREGVVPLCQDTGLAVFLVEWGVEARLDRGTLSDAINDGVRKGYAEGYLRKSVVSDPLRRVNTKDNTPAIVHVELAAGDGLRIQMAPKGGGSENMSTLKMLPPSAGIEGVRKLVVEWVEQAGANPCPPLLVGVGIGGNFEMCAYLAKKALFRPLGRPNPDAFYAELERDLLGRINALGIGPMGLGGTQTALAVHIEWRPCHIVALPVAVNIQCHSARHTEVTL